MMLFMEKTIKSIRLPCLRHYLLILCQKGFTKLLINITAGKPKKDEPMPMPPGGGMGGMY
jgi:hypothetical protein